MPSSSGSACAYVCMCVLVPQTCLIMLVNLHCCCFAQLIQRRCKVCGGSGLVQRGRFQRKCPGEEARLCRTQHQTFHPAVPRFHQVLRAARCRLGLLPLQSVGASSLGSAGACFCLPMHALGMEVSACLTRVAFIKKCSQCQQHQRQPGRLAWCIAS